ncbi:hypothetical protein MNBD_GAMMA22-199 [hydrothermal vent metagenome]|uniref:DUF58 domain-containing protein n=1 Tax=hydrothermal vent metagenome TaxID=652676 RepID=A0A3B1AR86_9ZZZZ
MRKILDKYLWRSYRKISTVSYWVIRRFTPTGKVVLALMFFSGLLGIDIQQVQSYQLFIISFVLIAIAFISVLTKKCILKADRNLPRYACVNEDMQYQITLYNVGKKNIGKIFILDEAADPRPTLQSFINTQEPRNVTRSRFDRFFRFPRWRWLLEKNTIVKPIITEVETIKSKSQVIITASLKPLRRGVVALKTIIVLLPDNFGIYCAIKKIPCYQSLTVLPKRYSVPSLSLSAKRQHNQGGVNNASSVGDAQEFTSLREYQAGDSIRNIHWNSWAKTAQPVVKQYQEEYFSRYGLILDTFGNDDKLEQFEEAVSIAASYVYSLNELDTFIDLMFVSDKAYQISSGRGMVQRDNMLEVLAAVTARKNKDFNNLLSLITKNLNILSSAIIVLIDWDKNREALLKLLQLNNTPYHAFLIRSNNNAQAKVSYHEYNITELYVDNIETGLSVL